MIHKVDSLINNSVEINGKWYISRPLRWSFFNRLSDAVMVLKWRATAIRFEEDDHDDMLNYLSSI